MLHRYTMRYDSRTAIQHICLMLATHPTLSERLIDPRLLSLAQESWISISKVALRP